MLLRRRNLATSSSQCGSRRRPHVVPQTSTRCHHKSSPEVPGLPSLPFKLKFQDALCKTSECIEQCSSEIVKRGRDDIRTCRQASAPLSKYSEVWTFPICLIIYSTMVIAWSSELAGALLVQTLAFAAVPEKETSRYCARRRTIASGSDAMPMRPRKTN
jgi:hypothetical protein